MESSKSAESHLREVRVGILVGENQASRADTVVSALAVPDG
jgi:hypothetical protein